MIKLTQCDDGGGNERVAWINVDHIVLVEDWPGGTMLWLNRGLGLRVVVTESVDDVIKVMTRAY